MLSHSAPGARRTGDLVLALFAASVVFSGCAMAPRGSAPTLTAENGAEAYSARSLQDPGLRRFLRENIGHEPETWDFETLCWVGFYYQPSLEVARAQWAAARAGVRIAGERPNPTLTLAPGYDFTRQPGVSPWMPTISLDWLFQNTTARQRQVDAADAEAEAARLGVFVAAWEMRSELRQALIEADVATRREALLQTQAKAQRQVLALLEQRFEAGSIAATEVSVARSAALRAEAAMADAARQAAQARNRVATAVGLPVGALKALSLPVPSVPPRLSADEAQAARRRALQSRSDVVAALAKYQAAHLALAVELAKRFPDVHLGPAYQWDQGQNKGTLGIGFELPIFNRHEGAIAAALARRAEAAAQFNAVQNKAAGAIDAAIVALDLANAQADRSRQLHAETDRQTAAVRAQREAGAGDQLQLQSAELDAATTETALLDSEAAVQTAAGQLEDALQIPFANLTAVAGAAPTMP